VDRRGVEEGREGGIWSRHGLKSIGRGWEWLEWEYKWNDLIRVGGEVGFG
jgi:hypothetical protein